MLKKSELIALARGHVSIHVLKHLDKDSRKNLRCLRTIITIHFHIKQLDVSKDTLADWMKLTKSRVGKMKKYSSSASCSTTIPDSKTTRPTSKQPLKLVGHGSEKGRARGRQMSRKAIDSVSEESRSADWGSSSTDHITSQANHQLNHLENDPEMQEDRRSLSAILESKWVMTETTGLSPRILQEARIRAKEILQRAGYTVCFRSRKGKSKQEAYYLSPDGHLYYSILSACHNWKLHSSLPISKEENQIIQILGMYRQTTIYTQEHGNLRGRNKLSSVNNKKFKRRKVRRLESLTPTLEASGGTHIDKVNVSRADGPIQLFESKIMGRRRLSSYKNPFTGEHRHEKRRMKWLLRNRKKKLILLDENLESQPSKRMKRASDNSKKGKFCKSRTSRPHSNCRLEVLLSPSLRGKDDDRLVGAQPLGKITVLSSLIDMAVLEEHEKVQYMDRKDGKVMLEGWVTREGIICGCCNSILSVSEFEAHSGSNLHRPSVNIWLEDGRSLLECQMQALSIQGAPKKQPRSKENDIDESDDVCGVCGDGGQLICCDHCPSTFHLTCINMKDVPEGEWYCPSCRCAQCGRREFNGNADTFCEMTVLICDQCEREYHVGCLHAKGSTNMDHCLKEIWFCEYQCQEIFRSLRGLVGITHLLEDGLSWIVLRSSEEDSKDDMEPNIQADAEHNSKLPLALSVMQECFRPMTDSHTQIDIIPHVVYNRRAAVNRLNFRGFYTVLLERGDELISVACIRVHGQRLAEMPLIGTRFQYRRQGMCCRLITIIQEMLETLNVKTFVLPSVPELLETWTSNFGFESLSAEQRLELVELNILAFPGSTLLQKYLQKSSSQTIKTSSAELLVVNEEGEMKSGLETAYSSGVTTFPDDDGQEEEYENCEQTMTAQDWYDKALEVKHKEAEAQEMTKLENLVADNTEEILLHRNKVQENMRELATSQSKHPDTSQFEIAEINKSYLSEILEILAITRLVCNSPQKLEDVQPRTELLSSTSDLSSSKMPDKDNASSSPVPNDMGFKLFTGALSDCNRSFLHTHSIMEIDCPKELGLQYPPLGLYKKEDLQWKDAIHQGKGSLHQVKLAYVPYSRVDDFINGEAQNACFPTKFCKTHSWKMHRRTQYRLKVTQGSQYTVYKCQYGPQDRQQQACQTSVDPSCGPKYGQGSRKAKKSKKRGCQFMFYVTKLLQWPKVAEIRIHHAHHTNEKGEFCHGHLMQNSDNHPTRLAAFLSEAKKKWVKHKLLCKVVKQRILYDHEEEVYAKRQRDHNYKLTRDDYLSPKDVQNIERMVTKRVFQFHANDCDSVLIWMNLHKELVFFSHVEKGPHADSFVLGVQTPFMLESMLKWGHNSIVSMDTTFNSNKWHFHMYSLLVFDDQMNGIPVAWVLTHQATTENVAEWLQTLKKKLLAANPLWKPSAFLVDDCNVEIDAIKQVFGVECLIFLCLWHVRHSLVRNLLNTVTCLDARMRIMQHFGNIMHLDRSENSIGDAKDMLKALYVEYEGIYPAFFDSLKQEWGKNMDIWIKATRIMPHAGEDCVSSIEAYHLHLKTRASLTKKLLRGCRMDWIIHVLVDEVEVHYWYHMQCKEKGFVCNSKLERIVEHSLAKATRIPDDHVILPSLTDSRAFVRCGHVHEVTHSVILNAASDWAYCTCDRSSQGRICKHQIKILLSMNKMTSTASRISAFMHSCKIHGE